MSNRTLYEIERFSREPAFLRYEELSQEEIKELTGHLASCQYCRNALNSENNIEAGYQPAPGATATSQTQRQS